MSPVELVLSRLAKYQARANGQYIAPCPAHDDRSPSLSVREEQDGRVLLMCFAGCTVEEICGAIGIDLADLFPKTDSHHVPPRRVRMALTDAFHCLQYEATVVAVAADMLANNKPLSADDHERLRQSVRKLHEVNEAVYS